MLLYLIAILAIFTNAQTGTCACRCDSWSVDWPCQCDGLCDSMGDCCDDWSELCNVPSPPVVDCTECPTGTHTHDGEDDACFCDSNDMNTIDGTDCPPECPSETHSHEEVDGSCYCDSNDMYTTDGTDCPNCPSGTHPHDNEVACYCDSNDMETLDGQDCPADCAPGTHYHEEGGDDQEGGCYCDSSDLLTIDGTDCPGLYVNINGILMYNGGFVCDDGFGDEEAAVVCMEMGFNTFKSYMKYRENGYTNKFTMDDLDCPVGSTQLSECTFSTSEDCSSYESIYISCGDETSLFTLDSNGVLMFGNGYVCDDGFSDTEATMVCRQLGYSGFSSYSQAIDNRNTDDFVMDNLECPLGASRLKQCIYHLHDDCSSDDSISITCTGTESQFSFDDNFLLMFNGGYVCDDYFGELEATVACWEMGYNEFSTWSKNIDNRITDDFTMDNFNCPSGTTQLSQCSYFVEDDCSSSESVILTCDTDCPPGTHYHDGVALKKPGCYCDSNDMVVKNVKDCPPKCPPGAHWHEDGGCHCDDTDAYTINGMNCAPGASCLGRCGGVYNSNLQCQCDSVCMYMMLIPNFYSDRYVDCCDDYGQCSPPAVVYDCNSDTTNLDDTSDLLDTCWALAGVTIEDCTDIQNWYTYEGHLSSWDDIVVYLMFTYAVDLSNMKQKKASAGYFEYCKHIPSAAPTFSPSIQPSDEPSVPPTSPPTLHPTTPPTVDPTRAPTSDEPSAPPTVPPTFHPTTPPTVDPTRAPTQPTYDPTVHPTVHPTPSPTAFFCYENNACWASAGVTLEDCDDIDDWFQTYGIHETLGEVVEHMLIYEVNLTGMNYNKIVSQYEDYCRTLD